MVGIGLIDFRGNEPTLLADTYESTAAVASQFLIYMHASMISNLGDEN